MIFKYVKSVLSQHQKYRTQLNLFCANRIKTFHFTAHPMIKSSFSVRMKHKLVSRIYEMRNATVKDFWQIFKHEIAAAAASQAQHESWRLKCFPTVAKLSLPALHSTSSLPQDFLFCWTQPLLACTSVTGPACARVLHTRWRSSCNKLHLSCTWRLTWFLAFSIIIGLDHQWSNDCWALGGIQTECVPFCHQQELAIPIHITVLSALSLPH